MSVLLQKHLEILLSSETSSSRRWRTLTRNEQLRLKNIWASIENYSDENCNDLLHSYSYAFNKTKRWFVRVQEKEFQHSKIRIDWPNVVRDRNAIAQIYEQGSFNLLNFLRLGNYQSDAHYYGGIKETDSLDKKLLKKKAGNSIQRVEFDLWDIVRFRVVASGLDSLLRIAISFWETYFDYILKCTNYYYHPKKNFDNDPYRAIHFEICDNNGNPIEIQMVTKYRDAVSFLEHPFIFKKIIPFINSEHQKWLMELSVKANLLEFSRAKGP